MERALAYLWKEWRAQRALLLGYTALVFTCLCLGLTLVPQRLWLDDSFGVEVLAWFVRAGLFGVLVFAAPGLVRREFGARDDQFVRRLPGALWPAFVGKLLFLVSAAMLLPLLGLAIGELAIDAIGQDFAVCHWDGSLAEGLEGLLLEAGLALSMLPWIWAVGSWLPGGRMALLATALLVLVFGVAVTAIERQSPNIWNGVAWRECMLCVPVSGFVVAAASWLGGRRRGGCLSSARCGLVATFVLLLPWFGWAGERAFHYHNPRVERLANVAVWGTTPDGRYALVAASENGDWWPVQLRVDLQTARAERLSGAMTGWSAEVVWPPRMVARPQQRWWTAYGAYDVGEVASLLDLATGARHSVSWDPDRLRPELPDDLQQQVRMERRERPFLSVPGCRGVWCERGEIVFERENGAVERVPFPFEMARTVHAAGHGLEAVGGGRGERFFDLVRREVVPAAGDVLPGAARFGAMWIVGEVRVFTVSGRRGYFVQRGDSDAVACEQLRGCSVWGLLDDRSLLLRERAAHGGVRLCAFEPATGTKVSFSPALPSASWQLGVACPSEPCGSRLPRAPDGSLWIRVPGDGLDRYARLDVAERRVHMLPFTVGRHARMIDWGGGTHPLFDDHNRIVRVDAATGAQQVVFPPPRR